MTLLYEDITHQILSASFEIINELGAGFLEIVYQNSLELLLRDKGMQVVSRMPLDVCFRGVVVGTYQADLVVEQKVIVELKATYQLISEHQAQLINYLKATGYKVGLLINFGRPRIEYKRLELSSGLDGTYIEKK